jgi:hypothetical protein
MTVLQTLCLFFIDLEVTATPGTNPSPVPLRLVKTPAAVHPLPKGEGSLLETMSLAQTRGGGH